MFSILFLACALLFTDVGSLPAQEAASPPGQEQAPPKVDGGGEAAAPPQEAAPKKTPDADEDPKGIYRISIEPVSLAALHHSLNLLDEV